MKMKSSELITFSVAGIAAVLAIVLVYGYVQNRVAEAESKAQVKTITVVEKPEMRSVVVASRDMYRGEKVEPEDLKILSVPMESMGVKGVVVNPQEAVGRTLNQKVYAGEWLLEQKLGGELVSESTSLESLLAPGHRAMRLAVHADTGLLGILSPGDSVDVISVFESADSNRMISRVILQNISVLSIGQANRMTKRVPSTEQDFIDPETQVAKSMVALDLEVEQAEQLALAMNVGAIHLALRNPTDTAILKTDGVNLKVMEKGKQREPIYKPKAQRQVIELMQGNHVQEVITK